MGKIKKIFVIIICLLSLMITSCKKNEENEDTEDDVVSVEISEKSQLEFNENEFDLSKIILKITYESNIVEEIPLSKNMVTSNLDDINKVDKKVIEINAYSKKLQVEVTIKHKVKVENIYIHDDSILEFNYNEFDSSFIILEVVYSDNSTAEIEVSDDMITSGLDKISEAGSHQLTITYQEKIVNVNVTILQEVKVVNVEVSDWSQSTFEQNHIDYSKILLQVSYEDNTKRQISVSKNMIETDVTILSDIGVHDIVICYNDFRVNTEIVITPEIIYEDFIYELLPYGDGYAIAGYIGSSSSVVIPSTYNNFPVTEISDRAFYQNNDIVRVILPESIEQIGEAAFYKATNFSSIVIANKDVNIENYALASVKLIYLAGSVNTSWPEIWYDMQSSYIQENVDVRTIKFDGEYEYFIKNKELCVSNYVGDETEVVIPEIFSGQAPSILGGACFKGNSNVTSIIMPNSIREIETYCIAECTSLTNITLSNILEIFGDYALRGCTTLEHINLPNSLLEIGQNAFNMCSSLKEMIIPSKVTKVNGYAFAWCVSLTKIYIPKSVVTMSVGACYSCSKATIYLESSTIPSTWLEGWNMSNRPIKYNQTL